MMLDALKQEGRQDIKIWNKLCNKIHALWGAYLFIKLMAYLFIIIYY